MRRWKLYGVPTLLVSALGVTACGSDDPPPPQVIVIPPNPEPEPEPEKVDLLADVNRDGVIDALDNEGEDVWSDTAGASFLPNVDDDDEDGNVDATTLIVDGDADAVDLTKIVVAAWPEAPDGAVGKIFIDPGAIPHVHVYKSADDGGFDPTGTDVPRLVGSGWELAGGNEDATPDVVELTTEEIRSGVLLGFEGLRLAGLPESAGWSGLVDLTYGVYESASADSPIVPEGDSNADGNDRMQLRVAPWVMFGNATPEVDLVFANITFDDNQPFRDAIRQATEDAGVAFWEIGDHQDRWTQDWMQTGFTSMPYGEGVAGMRMTMPRPWGRGGLDDLPINWLERRLVTPDSGVFVVYEQPNTGDTYDSHGNHDLVPAYGNYPYGRIIYGSGVLPETKAFYEAQRVQAPAISVDTSWLIVGHVDEVFSYVPADTERGWKLLVGSADLAVQMMEEWSSQGFGDEVMFVGKAWSNGANAEITVDEALADPNLMADSQEAQSEIDGMLATLQADLNLAEDEIIEVPFLFEQDGGFGLVAYNPGTVNSLVFNNTIVIPDPFGPSIDGVDGFRKDLEDRLGTPVNGLGRDGQGLAVYFADDWFPYHINLGEVHCGSNIWGPPQREIRWWEVQR